MKKRTTIWIIEDNTYLRESLSEYIDESKDLECTGSFPNCETALGSLSRESAPKILLIDLGLPGMSGIEGIRKFKHRVPDIEALVLTIDDSREKVFEAIQAGASGYLLKTADGDEILDGCRKVAAGAASLNENVARMMLNAIRTNETAKPETMDATEEHGLTDREFEILQLLAEGYSAKQISDQLGISIPTVKFHCTHIYQKLNVPSQRTAVVEAQRRGIL